MSTSLNTIAHLSRATVLTMVQKDAYGIDNDLGRVDGINNESTTLDSSMALFHFARMDNPGPESVFRAVSVFYSIMKIMEV